MKPRITNQLVFSTEEKKVKIAKKNNTINNSKKKNHGKSKANMSNK